MKKRFYVPAVVVLLSSSVLFSSCIGSFSLFNKLLAWNKTVGDKFINELVFVAFCIVPIYEISWLADVLVLNSIEFWTGENPVAEGQVKKVDGENGKYTITTKKDGYHIQNDKTGDAADLNFNKDSKVWSVEANGESSKIIQITSDDEALMFLPDGTQVPVRLNEAGVLAFKQIVENKTFYAAR